MSENVFPVVWGGEEEGSWRFVSDQNDQRQLVGQADLDKAIKAYRKDPQVGGQSWGTYNDGRLDSTGGGLYRDRDQIELNTAEVETVEEYKQRLRGLEYRGPEVAKSFMKANTGVKGIDINRRVTDSKGNNWGMHDNAGYGFEGSKEQLYPIVDAHLTAHYLTRPVITGAGLVRGARLFFAQKMTKITSDIHSYGYNASLYRGTRDEGGMRIETRCSDINILEIPLDNRLCGTAIATAIAFTQEVREHRRFAKIHDYIRSRNLQSVASDFNQLRLTDEGKLIVPDAVRVALEHQRAQSEVFLEEMPNHADVPGVYTEGAKQHIALLDKIDRVLAGEETVAYIRRDTDWAAKFCLILRRIQRDRKKGYERTQYDGQAQRDDLAYDIIRVVRGADGVIEIEKAGYGYQLRDRYAGDAKPTEEQLRSWAMDPPASGRARLRAEILRDYVVDNGNWGQLAIKNRSTADNAGTVKVFMADPLQDSLNVPNQERLDMYARRRPVKK